MSRILVTGRYVNDSTYHLIDENGEIFKIIKEGEPFTIGNQMKPWNPVRVPKKKGNGTILMCQKYSGKGNVMDEFPLIPNMRGLWALTSGSARRGVFHWYHEPQNELERVLAKHDAGKSKIKRVDTIEGIQFEVEGPLCRHCSSGWKYDVVTDGIEERITEPLIVPKTHTNQYHWGCYASSYEAYFHNATYLVYYHIHTTMNGYWQRSIEAVYLTPHADENEVARLIDNEFVR